MVSVSTPAPLRVAEDESDCSGNHKTWSLIRQLLNTYWDLTCTRGKWCFCPPNIAKTWTLSSCMEGRRSGLHSVHCGQLESGSATFVSDPWASCFLGPRGGAWGADQCLLCSVFQYLCWWVPAACCCVSGWERIHCQRLRGENQTWWAQSLRIWPLPSVGLWQLGRGERKLHLYILWEKNKYQTVLLFIVYMKEEELALVKASWFQIN